jgi:hypothetical protein
VHPLCKLKALSSNPTPTKNKENETLVILATQEADIRNIVIQGQPRQKVDISTNSWAMVQACHPSYAVPCSTNRITVEASLVLK